MFLNHTVDYHASLAASRMLNHMVLNDAWAQNLLKAQASKQFVCQTSLFSLAFEIAPNGFLTPLEKSDNPAVRLTLDVPKLAQEMAQPKADVLQAARIEGEASLARTLSDLAQHLRWDTEEDLSHWVGDAAAHEIGKIAAQVPKTARAVFLQHSSGLADFLMHEKGVAVHQSELQAWSLEVADFAQQVKKLAAQLSGSTK